MMSFYFISSPSAHNVTLEWHLFGQLVSDRFNSQHQREQFIYIEREKDYWEG